MKSGDAFRITGPVGRIITGMREALGMSVNQLAAKADIAWTTVARWEEDRNVASDQRGQLRSLVCILDAMDVVLVTSPK